MAGIRSILGLSANEPLPASVASIKMGTTVATNALPERAGAKTLFVTTEGFADARRIAAIGSLTPTTLRPNRRVSRSARADARFASGSKMSRAVVPSSRRA